MPFQQQHTAQHPARETARASHQEPSAGGGSCSAQHLDSLGLSAHHANLPTRPQARVTPRGVSNSRKSNVKGFAKGDIGLTRA